MWNYITNKKVCMQNGAQLNHQMSTQCSTQYLSIKIPASIPGHFCSSSPKLKLHQPKKEVFVTLALRGSLHKLNGEQQFEARYLTWGGSRTRPLTFVSSGLNFIPNSLISGSLSYLFTSMAWKKILIVSKVLKTGLCVHSNNRLEVCTL